MSKDLLLSTKVHTTGSVVKLSCHSSIKYQNSFYVFGGYNDDVNNDVDTFYEFDLKNSIWKEIPKQKVWPPSRCSHICEVYKNSMYIFGGLGTKMMQDMWKFDFLTTSWTYVAPDVNLPQQRERSTSVLYKDSIFIFGGRNELHLLSDIHEYKIEKNEWNRVVLKSGTSQVRVGASGVLYNDTFIIFGGNDYFELKNTIVFFNLIEKTWKEISFDNSPSPRRSHSAVVYNDKMYIFGGKVYQDDEHEIFELDFKSSCWKSIPLIGYEIRKRGVHSMKVVENDIYIFAGMHTGIWYDDLIRISMDSNIFQKKLEKNLEASNYIDVQVTFEKGEL